jgi:two-component system nitrogen regulation sensor histidine kinase GlnL
MLAHEIKNPLAGIRGAAQLLKTGAKAEDQPLAQLIVDETDRIRRLVDRMEAFSDDALPREPVNIHQMLDRVRALAANGVADGLALQEHLRSLAAAGLGRRGPADPGVPEPGEERRRGRPHARRRPRRDLSITTAYRHGVRVRAADGQHAARRAAGGARQSTTARACRPACASTCSSPSSPPRPTARAWAWPWSPSWSTGHGGLIDFESEPGRTVFRVLLPIATEKLSPEDDAHA